MWLMLQQPEPNDYVIATGESRSVREFLKTAFGSAGLDYQDYVETDSAFYRPAKPIPFIGDASKAHRALKWKPRVTFDELVGMMVDADIKRESAK